MASYMLTSKVPEEAHLLTRYTGDALDKLGAV